MSVAITGASGNLGRQVAELLLERLEPSEIVLVTRRPEALADLAERGAEVRSGDFDDPAGLEAALAGVDRALLISTDVVGDRVVQHSRAVAAAKAAGVRHLVYTSVPRPDADNPARVAAEHGGTEAAIRDSGLDWTFLRNGLYSEFQVPPAQQAIASGRLIANTGEGRSAYVARTDCAAAAAAVLATDGHEGQAYDITGPEALSAADLAALFGELGGTTVELVLVDDDAYRAGLLEAGLPASLVETLVTFGQAIREGWLADVSDAVERLTGRPPRTLRDVLVEAGVGA
jgi:NAD(P)H dehydrogenase (quinone)